MLYSLYRRNSQDQLRGVVTGEYAINWVANNGDIYAVVTSGSTYGVTKINTLSNIIGWDGGQYNTVVFDNNNVVHSIIGGTTNVTSYPVDNLGNPFKATFVSGIYKNILAIQNGELYYWSAAQANPANNEDILLQFGGPQLTPRKLTQPPSTFLTKVVSGSFSAYGTSTCALALGSDGKVWKWTRGNTTPTQLTYPNNTTDMARDIAIIGATAIVVETFSGKLYAIANAYQDFVKYAGTNVSSAGWVDITSNWVNAGCVLPSKKIATTYNTIHIIDSNNNLFAAGSNVQGTIGDGRQTPSWLSYTAYGTPSPYLWGFTNFEQMVLPKQIRGKWADVVGNNTVAFYLYGKDIGGEWYSWGRNKGRVLGNGVTLNFSNEASYSEFLNIPAARSVTPLSQTWTVLPNVNINANRAPIANAGIAQYIYDGSSTTTLYADYSHQQQPTNVTTITMSYNWSQISGPNTAAIGSANSISTNVSNLINGTYIFRLKVTNSVGLEDIHDVKVVVSNVAGGGGSGTPPSVNAGQNRTILTPTNSVTLSGSASDSDGTIVSYLWSKDSGPACTIVSPNSSTTVVNGLSVGIYVFRLTVTDNSGLNASSTVTITVDNPITGQNLINVSGWNAYVKLPSDYQSNPTKYYPTIIFFPGLGEVGTNAAKLLQAGPSAYIAGGWNGNVTIDGEIVQFIVISLQPSSSYPHETLINAKIEELKGLYRIDNNKLNLTGLSHGGWCSTRYAAYYPTKVSSIVNVQGVQPFNTVDYVSQFSPWVNNGGRCLNLEQVNDFRDMFNLTNALNSVVSNSAIYIQTNIGGGGHCCWGNFYGAGAAPNNFNIEGKTESIYHWIARQSL